MTTRGMYGGRPQQQQMDYSRDIPLTPQPNNRNPFDDTTNRRSFGSDHPASARPWESDNQSIYTTGPTEKMELDGRHRFKSYRLKGKYEKPWEGDPRAKKGKVGNWIVRGFIFIGFALCAYINYASYTAVAKHDVGVCVLRKQTWLTHFLVLSHLRRQLPNS